MKNKFIYALCLVPCALLGVCHTPLLAADDNCYDRHDVPSGELTLEQVIDLGLCRNPTTAAAYLNAETARLNKNAGYAPYLPSINASANAGKQYRNQQLDQDWSYGASLSASYLIFDFGKRFSDLSALASTWRATGFDYDDSVQNYVYSVIGAYYSLLTADANLASTDSVQRAAQLARDTADKKFRAGAVAKADVLKADTTLASRKLDSERARNNREIAKGKLLSLLSFSQSQEIKIADMPSAFGTRAENKSVDQLIADAKKSRPDVLSSMASKDAAWHRRNSRFLSNLPSISATGSLSWNNTPTDVFNAGYDHVSGSIGIRASMPIFAGFANVYGVRAAEANYERAGELERAANDSAELDVFTAYNNYQTAQNVLAQSSVLLKSATESERVVAGMYKVGRSTMLDWLNAQSDLANAQNQNNSAKYDLFVKRAALAMAVGELTDEVRNKDQGQGSGTSVDTNDE